MFAVNANKRLRRSSMYTCYHAPQYCRISSRIRPQVQNNVNGPHIGYVGRVFRFVGLLKELIKLSTRADNNQSAREVQGTGQARSMQRNTKQELNL